MRLRVGLVGCGGIGRLRAAALASTPSLDLVAVNDVDDARAKEVASKYGAAKVGDWRALLDREDVQVVIVSTPPSLHARMSIAALQRGKHVLCEKPLARTPSECREIIGATSANGPLLATGFNYRFYPSILKAKQIVDSGLIGELDHVRSYAGYSAAEHSQAWLRDVEEVGGGALYDNGIHLIDLTRYFLGEVGAVKGFASNAVWGFKGCEDNGFALLRGPQGATASLHASWTEWRGYRFQIEVSGTLGFLHASCFPMLTRVVWSTERGGPTRRKRFFFPKTQIMEHVRSYRWVVVQSFIRELEAFSERIRGRPSVLASGNDGLRALEIAHAASREVKLTSRPPHSRRKAEVEEH